MATPPDNIPDKTIRGHDIRDLRPDKTEQATLTVIEQAEAIAKDWAN